MADLRKNHSRYHASIQPEIFTFREPGAIINPKNRYFLDNLTVWGISQMSKYERVYNFSAGPSMLPLEVLENVQKDLLNYKGTGRESNILDHKGKEL